MPDMKPATLHKVGTKLDSKSPKPVRSRRKKKSNKSGRAGHSEESAQNKEEINRALTKLK
jgi:hypothetical protein